MSGPAREPVAPYMAVGLSTVVHGIGSRRDIERNLVECLTGFGQRPGVAYHQYQSVRLGRRALFRNDQRGAARCDAYTH